MCNNCIKFLALFLNITNFFYFYFLRNEDIKYLFLSIIILVQYAYICLNLMAVMASNFYQKLSKLKSGLITILYTCLDKRCFSLRVFKKFVFFSLKFVLSIRLNKLRLLRLHRFYMISQNCSCTALVGYFSLQKIN